METRPVILAYQTDSWHTVDTRELVYIGENLEDIIAQLIAYRGMSREDAEQIRLNGQTQCNNRDYEWEFEKQCLNAFVE